MPKSVIHNDLNDHNLLVSRTGSDDWFPARISGVIDFGDTVYSWTIGELAIAIAYSMLEHPDPLDVACQMLSGYETARHKPVSPPEIEVLFGLACIRLCVSAVIAARQIKDHPGNDYLDISQQSIRQTLPRLTGIRFPFAAACLRQQLDRPVIPSAETVLTWLDERQNTFAFPINPFSPGNQPSPDQLIVLDLSVSSPLLPVDIDGITEPQIARLVQDELDSSGALIAVGRYREPRVLYSAGHFANPNIAESNRTVHLGIDLFADAETDVIAPLDGIVHYAGVIDKPLDYGGLLVLQHETECGAPFFTLYGHLNPASINHAKAGERVEQGDVIARLGTPAVNGGWTPHLHFQLMLDLLGLEHEFPGVAHAQTESVWSSISPDPNVILGIDRQLFPKPDPTARETQDARRRALGPGLSLGYQRPVKVARGWKQYLFDQHGQRLLDAYNNVPHVGHNHPAVVEAVGRQMRTLNTNTRYLHDHICTLAERVAQTMPEGLDVCYFVNSATEANELALRLAREHTGARDLIVLEGAYHGHSTTLIDISPYKHDGPGGKGAPDWVHSAPLADVYRGEFRNPATAGEDYARAVQQITDTLDRPLCGFICESCPSVGGQILFPENYLKRVYQYVREAGGVCIADDVQTGYGRLGSTMYGFSGQGVIPDIVILGKPIGNGMPLAAVVTTRKIAESFDNGMEFFSTFGGNPVSCAAGLAVLDVLEREQLQQNARLVGNYLLNAFHELQQEFELIGDVRGQGFFLGMELVRDRETQSPAALEAAWIANACRNRNVLIGTDGPWHNVLKIRPPMCFDLDNANQLLEQLRESFRLLCR